jgi:hypothetical protein
MPARPLNRGTNLNPFSLYRVKAAVNLASRRRTIMLNEFVAAITTVSILAALYLLCMDIHQLNRLRPRSPGHNSKSIAGR